MVSKTIRNETSLSRDLSLSSFKLHVKSTTVNLISTLIYSVFYCLVHNVCSFYSRFLLEELKYTERRQAYLGVQKISLISLQRLVKYTTMNLLLNLVYNILYCLIHNVCSMCSPFLLVGLECCASHLNSERQFKCNKKKKKSRFKSTRKQLKNRKQSLGLKLVFNHAVQYYKCIDSEVSQ